jgi:hypothetical protein
MFDCDSFCERELHINQKKRLKIEKMTGDRGTRTWVARLKSLRPIYYTTGTRYEKAVWNSPLSHWQ